MTDQTESLPDPQWAMPEPDEPTDYTAWTQPQAATVTQVTPAASRYPYQLADHLITVSFGPNKPASVTVRGNSAVEIAAILEELAAEGVYTQIAHATQIFGGATPPAETVMQQLGAAPVAQYPPAGQPAAVGYAAPGPAAQSGGWAGPQGPPVPSAGPAPFGAPAGGYAPPQGAQWGGGANQPPPRPAGWYAVKAPFQARDAFDAVKNQLKAQGLYTGNMKWEGPTKTWLVSPAIAQYFQQWGPVPA